MITNFERSLALIQASAHDYGVKELADLLNKGTSTLYAELNQTEGYKLGARDFFKIIEKTGDISPLKTLLSDLGFALYRLPKSDKEKYPSPSSFFVILGSANRECAETFGATLEILEDGIVTRKEAVRGSDECTEAINALVKLKAKYDAVKTGETPMDQT